MSDIKKVKPVLDLESNSDIEKIKAIHSLKSNFTLDDSLFTNLLDQISSPDKKANLDRFFDGYTVEDHFQILFCTLPWVKLIHQLGQRQYPLYSKDKYQVTDFMLFHETSTLKMRPLIVEIKSVKKEKENLEVMKKQLDLSIEYAKVLNVPLVYAIYWQKLGLWSLNTVDQFEQNSKHIKINWVSALKQDISSILGNHRFLVLKTLYRKTI